VLAEMKNPELFSGVDSWGPGIRTPTYGSRDRCPTVRRAPTSEGNFIIDEIVSQIIQVLMPENRNREKSLPAVIKRLGYKH